MCVFWPNVLDFITDTVGEDATLQWKDVLLDIVENSENTAKFRIHNCTFSGKKSMLYSILNEVKHYIESILPSKKLKADLIVQVCAVFNVFYDIIKSFKIILYLL